MKRIFLISILIFLSACASNIDNNTYFSENSEKTKFIKYVNQPSEEITIKRGMATTIQFNSLINYYVLGDDLVADANQINSYTVLLSAKIANEITNINVSTAEGNYVFVIKTIDYDNNKIIPNLHIVVGNKHLKPKQIDNIVKSQQFTNNPNFDYKFSMYTETWCGFFKLCNYKEIAPQRVWTDGIYTYLDYSNKGGINRDIPQTMEIKDNIDTPVNYTVKDNIIIVHTLAKRIVIKSGNAYICIEYKGSKYEIS